MCNVVDFFLFKEEIYLFKKYQNLIDEQRVIVNFFFFWW